MLNINETIFQENLLITQAYCDQQLKRTQKNRAAILRSFNPVVKDKEIFSFQLGRFGEDSEGEFLFFSKWNINPLEEENKYLYDELFALQLQHKKDIIGKPVPSDIKGQILIVEIDSVIVDGISETESDGFIDSNDCPPIDTWVYLIENENKRLLFAWIPEPFIKTVEQGIEVNMLATFYWHREARSESDNWHDEQLGEQPKVAIVGSDAQPSVFSRLKKMFS